MKNIYIPVSILILIVITIILIMKSTIKVDMLLVNAKVYTLDSSNTIAEALAIKGDKIISVGSTKDLKKEFSSERIIDLQGKTVIPGLIDGHAHILGEGGRLETIDLVATNSIEDIINKILERKKNLKPGEWIIGRGWDQNNWEKKEFPTKEILDETCPQNPVILRRIDGHAVWVNSKTLALAGIDKNTEEPKGGKILRDKAHNPTGVLIDNAIELINKIIPELSEEDIERRVKLAMNECVRFGLTEVHDMGVDLKTIQVYKRLIDKGECPIRIYAAIDYPSETWLKYLQTGPEYSYGNGMLVVRAVKLYMDGALGSRGAALIDEYSDDPGNRGLTIMSEAEMDTVCRNAFAKGFQVCTHAIGDRANNLTLNGYERAVGKNSSSLDLRWRVEHAQVLNLDDIPRFTQLRILPSMQPTHATSDMDWAELRVGKERIRGAYAWRSILQTGSHIIGGSDFPVEFVNPLFGIYAAVTRKDRDGNPPDGWYKEQCMTREEAIRCFTEWAAYGAFQEKVKGTLEKNKWADITVINKDIFNIPPEDILRTEVEMTIVAGKVVFSK